MDVVDKNGKSAVLLAAEANHVNILQVRRGGGGGGDFRVACFMRNHSSYIILYTDNPF